MQPENEQCRINNGQYKISVEQRLSRIETIVDEIKNNHLVHLEAKMDRMNWLIIVSLVGVLANLISRVV